MRGYPPSSSSGRRRSGGNDSSWDLDGNNQTTARNAVNLASGIKTGVGAVNKTYADIGNSLLEIVDNSNNLAQAQAKINKMNISEARKQLLREQVQQYYLSGNAQGALGGGGR